jgi:hypothetical protein
VKVAGFRHYITRLVLYKMLAENVATQAKAVNIVCGSMHGAI